MNRLMKALVLLSALSLTARGSVSASPSGPPDVGAPNNDPGSTNSPSGNTQSMPAFGVSSSAGSDATGGEVQPAGSSGISNNTTSTAPTSSSDPTVPVAANGATNSSSDLATSSYGQNTNSTGTNSPPTTQTATDASLALNDTTSVNAPSVSNSTSDATDENPVFSPANATSPYNSAPTTNQTSLINNSDVSNTTLDSAPSTLADPSGGLNSSASAVSNTTIDSSPSALADPYGGLNSSASAVSNTTLDSAPSTSADPYGGLNSSSSAVSNSINDASQNATGANLNDTSLADSPVEAGNSTEYNDASLASNVTGDASVAPTVSNDTSLVSSTGLYNETLASINGTAPSGNSTWGSYGSSGTYNSTSTNSTSNSTETVGSVRTFVLSQTVSWSHSDFSIYDNNGPVAYVITNHAAGVNSTTEDVIMKVGSTGEKKIKVDAYVGHCGKRTNWSVDDGTKITLDPRGFLPDRWYIKNTAFPKEEYTFFRAIYSLQGDIVESGSARTVATITEQKLKSALPNLPFASGDKVFIVTNNGVIPDWDLLTMLALAAQRYQNCRL